MLTFSNAAVLAAISSTLILPLSFALASPGPEASPARPPTTTCTTFTQLLTTTETRYPQGVETSIILIEYPVVTTTTVYATNTSTVLFTTSRTRVRTRTETETVSACTVY